MTKDEALKIALDYVLRTTYWTEGRDRHDTLKAIKEALAQDEQELVHSVQSNGRHSPLLTHMMNKRTTPPKRPWVGLTEDEMSEIAAQGHQRWKEHAQAIEAKLKEKNT